VTHLAKALVAALEACLQSTVTKIERVTGGDINDTFLLTLDNGLTRFLKTHARPPRGMFQAEARGLRWLAEAQALRIPEVIAVSDTDAPHQFLVLEAIRPGGKARDHDEALGRGLARLHQSSPGSFGLDHDNFLATLPQANQPCPFSSSWPDFYATRRLEPLLKRAVDSGHADSALTKAVSGVIDRIESLVGPSESPARLHGDLWAGNAITDHGGLPVLIDPAVYGGHREVDLAMMRLFGGFSARVFDAYQEAYPLAAGHEQRVALYQLYPLLAHVNLFGGHYVTSATAAAVKALT